MRYIEQLLTRDETIRLEARKHWVLFAGPLLLFAIAAVAYSVPAPVVFTLGFALGVIALLYAAIAYATSSLALTETRLLARSGLVPRKGLEVEREDVAEIRVIQGPWGRLLNFGTVEVHTRDGKRTRFIRIADPKGFAAAVGRRFDAAAVGA